MMGGVGGGGGQRILFVCHNKIYLNLLLGSVIFLQFSLIGPLTLLVTINWSPLHSLQSPCDLPQILPHPLQAINTDLSFILKTIIVTFSFTPVPWAPLLFYFWGLISGLQYIFFFTLFDCFNAFYFLFLFLNDLIVVCSVSAGFALNEFRPRSVSPITRMVSPRLTVSDYPG